MPQSLANVLVHIVFSTKERRALLQIPDLRDEMHRYMAGISANLECPAIIVGGTTDHVHLLAAQSRTITMADWVKELKRASSLWAKKKSRQWSLFQWQAGYGAFSVSQSQKAGAGIHPNARGTSSAVVISGRATTASEKTRYCI